MQQFYTKNRTIANLISKNLPSALESLTQKTAKAEAKHRQEPFSVLFQFLSVSLEKIETEMKILIVEDEPSLREITQRFLEKERYVVETAATFREALDKILLYNYECILLDIMLPDGDGLTLLQELKKLNKQENVIIVSAKDSVDDKVAGLELGADDYLAKPFHLSELGARVKSLIRRNRHNGEVAVEAGNVKIVPDKFEVYVNGQPLELNRKEYDILHYFITRPNRLVDKAALAEAVWGDHIDQVDNYDFMYAQIKNLRKKMNEAGTDIEIKAVYGFGYKLTGDGL